MMWECVQPLSISVLFDKLEILHKTVTDKMIDKHCCTTESMFYLRLANQVAN